MGHPVDIFTAPPSDSAICAICHDVLKDAVSMKECGHTFCQECAAACLRSSRRCPNCRVYVTGSNPCYFARDSIGSMQVKCPHGSDEEGTDESNKRRKGDNGEAVPEECCNWVGRCEDFKNHDDLCQLKVISCSIDGCSHRSRRKDMDSHLTGDSLLRHIDLMKQSFTATCEQKIQEMQQKMDRHSNLSQQKINSLENKIGAMFTLIKELGPSHIHVKDCGVPEINGVYNKDGLSPDTICPKYTKKSLWHGEKVLFTIHREKNARAYLFDRWYISLFGKNKDDVENSDDENALSDDEYGVLVKKFYYVDSTEDNHVAPPTCTWRSKRNPFLSYDPPPSVHTSSNECSFCECNLLGTRY